MKLWGGRFTKETNELVNNFNASISFDQKFYKQDIEGSIAHATMLGKQGIIPESESEQIVEGLKGILADIESGKLEITDEYEDIHTFMEATLIERIGDAGKRLHTGRSRNDQVALDMRLFTRQEVLNTDAELKELMAVILRIMKENTHTFMPGFTHLQKAQPVTVAHHFGAYFEMFKRDRSRLHDIYERMNYCPLGAGALAGTTYPLDRELTASLLGFYGPTLNSMDSVSDRDYLIEFLSALSTIMMHLSRFSEEICIWNSNEYRFIELDDAFTAVPSTSTLSAVFFSPNCFCDKCASLRNLQMRLPISNIPNGPLPLPYSVPFDTPIYLLYNQKNNSNSAILGKILDSKGGKRLCLQQMPASTRRAKMPKRRIFPCAYWFAMTTQPLPVSWRKR